MIRCGMVELDITPPLGNTIPGYFYVRQSTGIRDPLYAKALVMESGGTQVAFVSLDCLTLTRSVVIRIRERIHAETGISPSNVMVSATHTHTGPPVKSNTIFEANHEYLDWMADKAADAAIMAYRTRREAQVGFASGHEEDIAFNRRFRMNDGTVKTNPGIGNPQVHCATGPIDPEVSVMRIDDTAGNPIGVVTNYACHTDVVGGTEYSGDYPGELSAVIKKVLGAEVVSLFMMGASGNINHIDVQGGCSDDNASLSRHYEKMGRILAGEVVKVREKIRTSPDSVKLEIRQSFFPMEYRAPTDSEVSAARTTLRTVSPQDVEHAFAKELLEAAEMKDGAVEIEIQAVRIGDYAVIGLPAELFVEFGLEIKDKSPFRMTFINELCNGSVDAYLCTREAYRQGGYEPRITSKNRLVEEAGEIMVKQSLELLQRMTVPDRITNVPTTEAEREVGK
ncbi:neutral/alkaline non-lysosomal ceramidase N-terminal domain-containing protein [Paenibacillus sp. J5C2022]|uniref:neutral/alkaline non-lysosomal ceramidase N-terminal domain-containing protein n=1 Tax=Paenibacillus sp. J5C2022 TaxID=2977129 RepID=UPI0021D12D49|nr:neutral/alkaline non-lysosomal ceramidase N-terminal domain-containing protein [Paenibacillus sp. J5C2022]